MANRKLSASTAMTSPSSGDLLMVVDVLDITDGPGGTNKKITWTDMASALSPLIFTLGDQEYVQEGLGAGDEKTFAFDWGNGKDQVVQLVSGANNVFTFSNPAGGGHYMVIMKQPISGVPGTVEYPAGLMWANAIEGSTTPVTGRVDALFVVYSGTLGGYFVSLVNDIRIPS